MADYTFYDTTEQVSPTSLPLADGRRDLEAVLKINEEQFHKLYPILRYYPLYRQEFWLDPLYNESKTKEFHYEKPILVPILVVVNPPLTLLRRYGIEEEQEVIAITCNRVNRKAGIDPTTGDRLQYYSITYEVLTSKYTDYFLNTQVPLNKVAVLRQISESKPPTQENEDWWLHETDP
jgi:hypothetical protein